MTNVPALVLVDYLVLENLIQAICRQYYYDYLHFYFSWKVICFRVLVNTLVVGLLSCSAFAVVIVVKRSTEPEANTTVWRRNEITVVMSLITLFFPMLFEVLGFVEQYHPRKQLRLQLARYVKVILNYISGVRSIEAFPYIFFEIFFFSFILTIEFVVE